MGVRSRWGGTSGFISSGLIAEWRFDDGSGDVLNDYAGSNDGELGSASGADANDPNWVSEGLDYTSANTDRVRVPYFQDPTGNWTLIFVVEWDAASSTGRQIFSQENGTGTGRTWLSVNGADQAFSFIGNTALTHTTALTTGYHTLALTHNSGTLALYRNGVSPVSAARTAEAATGQYKIGISQIDDQGWNTVIAYGLVYNRALSESEVTQMHNWLKASIGRGITLP